MFVALHYPLASIVFVQVCVCFKWLSVGECIGVCVSECVCVIYQMLAFVCVQVPVKLT